MASSSSKYSNSCGPLARLINDSLSSFRKREFASTADDADKLDVATAADAEDDDELKKKSRVDDNAASLGSRLTQLVRRACVKSKTPFKDDPMTWGVTLETDARMTPARFGEYKSTQRRETETKLREYMSAASRSRETGLSEFSIGVTVAAPGTGKTRLLDDALRMPLDTTHFAHVLRLAITFNGFTTHVCAHPIATRVLREFFCGPASDDARNELKKIDKQLSKLFPDDDTDDVALRVLEALEALYFQPRDDGALGRSVLLMDEVSKALVDAYGGEERCEKHVYRTVVSWVDVAKGRRGAVFTGLTIVSPWAEVSSSARPLVWLPLGTFDVWDEVVQGVIEQQAQREWPGVGEFEPQTWSLLAATGGRPRDIFRVVEHLKEKSGGPIATADRLTLLNALYAVERPDDTFATYLLPSLLSIEFKSFVGGAPTLFGRHAASSALLNADQLATADPAVPAVSLRYVDSLPKGDDGRSDLRLAVRALVSALVFDVLDGTGKDFELVWVLLTYSILQAQHLVRGNALTSFWPTAEAGVALGGPARPTAKEIDIFAGDNRIEALFLCPDDDRVFEAPGATIRRKISLRQKPKLALWKDAWAATVEAGSQAPKDWPRMMTLDVEWRASTLVYFENKSNAAIDFMLLVGEQGGTGDNEPHVYMFQCKALSAENVAQAKIAVIVQKLQEKLDVLFGESHDSTHVLHRAGIRSMRQVTLCVAAINLGVKIDLKALGAPFNIVLFDSADFRGLGGAAFRDTWFFRSIAATKK